MGWQIEFSPVIEKELSKIDPQIAKRITNFLRNRVALLDDPRGIGEALTVPLLGKLWKYRVGDTESSATSRMVGCRFWLSGLEQARGLSHLL